MEQSRLWSSTRSRIPSGSCGLWGRQRLAAVRRRQIRSERVVNGSGTGASEQVQALYKQTCISCHGGNLEGRVGPATNLQKVGTKLSKEQIAKQIANGGGGMPAFGTKLKPEEVEALAAWLAEKNKRLCRRCVTVQAVPP
ncbi:cytochrome c [Paenibacillus sp. P25]|nr:cytochrome c [Paenibacillus sp. P25]